jgi:vancomycin resistance protein YoaR
MPRPLRITLFVAAVPMVLWAWLGAVYALDRAGDAQEVLGRVTVGDIPIGGFSEAEARQAIADLHRRLADEPIIVTIEGTDFPLIPREVGFRIDEEAILSEVMATGRDGGWFSQMRRWVATTFGGSTRVVDTAGTYSRESLISLLELWERIGIADPPDEGGIAVVAGEVVPVYPTAGTGIDLETTADLIEVELFGDRGAVTAVTEYRVPVVTDDDVDDAVAQAQRLIAGPVTLSKILPPASITFPQSVLQGSISSRVAIAEADTPVIDLFFQVGPLVQYLNPIRDTIETPPQDAQVVIRPDDVPLILPGANGALVDDARLPQAVLDAASSVTRTAPLPMREGIPPTFTTDDAEALGIKELLYTATTFFVPGGDEANRNRIINIQTMADELNGVIVMPGEVFSINEYVGRRTEERGYRRAGAIIGANIYCCDHPANVGGGVSQFATTMYNAVYWSGLEDVQHQPHSLYIRRYPMVREATLGWPTPDLKFRNDTEHAIYIKTEYTNNSVTVKFFGDNGGIRVEGETSERQDFTDPEVFYEPDPTVPPGEEEMRDDGEPGFTASDTRIIYNADGTERSRQTWTWRYQPWPIIVAIHPCMLPVGHIQYDSSIKCPVQVPDTLIGMTHSEATQALNAIGLRIAHGEDVIVANPDQHGRIVSHTPPAGTWLDLRSEVTVRLGQYVDEEAGE